MQPATNGIAIEGFYDWCPGVVVTADCLGRSYQTTLAGRALIVTVPSFDGIAVVEPPLRYRRPEQWVNVDPPHPWGELRIRILPKTGQSCPSRFASSVSESRCGRVRTTPSISS
jgi:hypothetical protein